MYQGKVLEKFVIFIIRQTLLKKCEYVYYIFFNFCEKTYVEACIELSIFFTHKLKLF